MDGANGVNKILESPEDIDGQSEACTAEVREIKGEVKKWQRKRPPRNKVKHESVGLPEKKNRFQYGNYNRYYGYRYLNFDSDPRFKCLKREWFEDQHVLDIGCNTGCVTFAIAKDFNPHLIVGSDIDGKLIRAANRRLKQDQDNLKQTLRRPRLDIQSSSKFKPNNDGGSKTNLVNVTSPDHQKTFSQEYQEAKQPTTDSMESVESPHAGDESPVQSTHNEIETYDLSMKLNKDIQSARPRSEKIEPLIEPIPTLDGHSVSPNEGCDIVNRLNPFERSRDSSTQSFTSGKSYSLQISKYPHNIQFICQNYVPLTERSLQCEEAKFDCILCLSVTKWIHLNFGDEGLKQSFKRMYLQLRPGGRLILEPQPWSSYKKKKITSETGLKHFSTITFRPDHFNEYLLSDECGFSSVQLLDTPNHDSKGFQRPMFMFIKSKDTPCD